jgi:hypothetical protein
MKNQSSSSNPKLTSFSPEDSTTNISSKSKTDVNKESKNIFNQDIVSRPLLWGLVVFLIFFSFVIGGVSIYRIYKPVESNIYSENIMEPGSLSNDDSYIDVDPVREADLIESEIQSIDTDLEADVYSDSSLGL